MKRTASFLVFLVALLWCVMTVSASDTNPGVGEPFDEQSGLIPSLCRATFPRPTLYAGSPVDSVIACRNGGEHGGSKVAFLVAGFLQPAHVYHSVLQNFSVVRQARTIEKGETVSFRYSFLPSSYLEPGDYNLVLSVYFQAGASNQTFLSVAFNSTVALEASNTDPRTVMTYFTLAVILCGILYGVAAKVGAFKPKASSTSQREAHRPSSPSAEGYDMDYINKEHLRYCEQLSNNKGSPKSNGSKKKF